MRIIATTCFFWMLSLSAGCETPRTASNDASNGTDSSERRDVYAPPMLIIRDGSVHTDFDQYWCRGSMIPDQDPLFPEIRRDRFQIDPVSDQVTIPADWIVEARDVRMPQLRAAAAHRIPVLLRNAAERVQRPFEQQRFEYFFYLCPFYNGGTGSTNTFPLFMYLESAVGGILHFPDWIFTDQYLFHELLHYYVYESLDLQVGTPILNALYSELLIDAEFTAAAQRYLNYPDPITPEYEAMWPAHQLEMIGAVIVHVHVYAIMTEVFRTIGEPEVVNTIRGYESAPPLAHPGYAKAWEIVHERYSDPDAMEELLAEIR